MYFTWTNKKETIDIGIIAGVSLDAWALPFYFGPHCGKYNTKLTNTKDKYITFVTTRSKGWYAYPSFRFLCFYLHIEFDRWYKGDVDGKNK